MVWFDSPVVLICAFTLIDSNVTKCLLILMIVTTKGKLEDLLNDNR